MSDHTRTALDDAIRAHLVDESDGKDVMLTHWVLVAGVFEHEDEDGTPFWIVSPEGQPTYVNAGLLYCALHPDTRE